MSGLSACTRRPAEDGTPASACPDCPHPAGFHAEDGCVLCFITGQAGRLSGTVAARPEAFTWEMAASASAALGTLARHLASVGTAVESTLAMHAEPPPARLSGELPPA